MGRRNRQANEKAAHARAGKAKEVAQSATHNESKAKKHASLAGDVSGLGVFMTFDFVKSVDVTSMT